MKNYFAKLRENEEKGFSLVELIIVMAIMAILVGVVASQVIPYMEKSRQAKDQQQLSGLATDITASLASAAVTAKDVTTPVEIDDTNLKSMVEEAAGASGTPDGDKLVAEFLSLRNDAADVDTAISDVKKKLKSKVALGTASKNPSDGKIYMTYDTATSVLTIFMSEDGTEDKAINKLTVKSE